MIVIENNEMEEILELLDSSIHYIESTEDIDHNTAIDKIYEARFRLNSHLIDLDIFPEESEA